MFHLFHSQQFQTWCCWHQFPSALFLSVAIKINWSQATLHFAIFYNTNTAWPYISCWRCKHFIKRLYRLERLALLLALCLCTVSQAVPPCSTFTVPMSLWCGDFEAQLESSCVSLWDCFVCCLQLFINSFLEAFSLQIISLQFPSTSSTTKVCTVCFVQLTLHSVLSKYPLSPQQCTSATRIPLEVSKLHSHFNRENMLWLPFILLHFVSALTNRNTLHFGVPRVYCFTKAPSILLLVISSDARRLRPSLVVLSSAQCPLRLCLALSEAFLVFHLWPRLPVWLLVLCHSQ